MTIPDERDDGRVRVADLPTARGLEHRVQDNGHPLVDAMSVRRARFAFSAGVEGSRACSDQVREVIVQLLLPELDSADSLVDWAAVTAGEFVAHLLHAVEGKITCEVRVDGEHLYVSVEAVDRCGGTCAVSRGGRLVHLISTDAGAYLNDDGRRVLWAAAEIIPMGRAAA